MILHHLPHAFAYALKNLFSRLSNLLRDVQHKVVVKLTRLDVGQQHRHIPATRTTHLGLVDDRLASVGEGLPTFGGCLCLCSADQRTRDLCQESCRLGTDVLDVLSELWRITVSGAETLSWCKTHAYSTKLVLLDDRRRLESCCLDHEEKERLDRVNAIAASTRVEDSPLV